MKRIFISLSLILSGFMVQSQTTSGWYNYGELIKYDMGQTVDYYLTHIFPDSTVQVEYSNGLGNVWMHGLGQVIDPMTDLYVLSSTGRIDSNFSYTVDSIAFPYRYFRTQNANPDTLKIQFFKEANIYNLYEDPWVGDPQYGGRSYARISYDSTLRRGDTPFMEITEILDFADTASIRKYKQYAINETIAAGEIIGATVTYLPGNPYNFGDTLDFEYQPTPTNQINDFIMNYFVDNDDMYSVGNYNHGIIATGDARYQDSTNNWNNQYWPGMASGAGIYHADISFKLTGIMTGIDEHSSITSFSVSPNPMKTEGYISFQLAEKSETSQLEIYDISGKLIYNQSLGLLFPGSHKIALPVKYLRNGLYFAKTTLAGETKIERVIVAK